MSNAPPVELSFDDLPKWAKDAVGTILGPRKRPRCYLEVTDSPAFGQPWHDACKVYYVARDQRGRIEYKSTPYYDSLPASTPEEKALFFGGKLVLPQDCAMMKVLTYPESVTLYVHPANAPKALPLPEVDLTPIQGAVLDAWVGYTSAGRKDLLSRYRVPGWLVDAVVAELVEMGLLAKNKSGAVSSTLKGRQVRAVNKSKTIDWYQWERCYDSITRRWSGFAREVLLEYREKKNTAA